MPISHPDPRVVLIAERDHTVRGLQRRFVEEAGYAVEFVDDGEAALARAREVVPTVLVTEIMLPKVDGLTVCRTLGADPITRHIPVLVFSILSASARAQDAGAKAYLRKPIVGAVFIATLDQLAANSNGKEQQWASHP